MQKTLILFNRSELQRETTTLRADRILAEELARLGCSRQELLARRKNDPAKLAIAARLRQETNLTLQDIAQRLNLGTRKSANTNLHRYLKASGHQIPLPFESQMPIVGI